MKGGGRKVSKGRREEATGEGEIGGRQGATLAGAGAAGTVTGGQLLQIYLLPAHLRKLRSKQPDRDAGPGPPGSLKSFESMTACDKRLLWTARDSQPVSVKASHAVTENNLLQAPEVRPPSRSLLLSPSSPSLIVPRVRK
eukprot:513885-Hanusia_phi.AAC.1